MALLLILGQNVSLDTQGNYREAHRRYSEGISGAISQAINLIGLRSALDMNIDDSLQKKTTIV